MTAALRDLARALETNFGVRVHRIEAYFDQDPKPISLPVPRCDGQPAAPAQAPPPRAEPSGCAGDVLRILREADGRLTCPEIMDEMQERGLTNWSERSVKRWLGRLVEQGLIDHDERARPPGYGLAP